MEEGAVRPSGEAPHRDVLGVPAEVMDVRRGPLEGHALVPETVVAWGGVLGCVGERLAGEEAEEVEAVGGGDDDPGVGG